MFNIGDEVYYILYNSFYDYETDSDMIPAEISKGKIEEIIQQSNGIKYKIRWGKGEFSYGYQCKRNVFKDKILAIEKSMTLYKKYITSHIND